MKTQLQKQLAVLSHGQEKVHAEHRASLLYPKGLDVSPETLLRRARNALATLNDQLLLKKGNELLNEQMLTYDRGTQTEMSVQHLDTRIKAFLSLLFPYFTHEEVGDILELLIYCFQVNIWNAEDLIFSLLPYHAMPSFLRVILVTKLSKTVFAFLLPSVKKIRRDAKKIPNYEEAKRGFPLSVFSSRIMRDRDLLRRLLRYGEYIDKANHSRCRAWLAFLSAILSEAYSVPAAFQHTASVSLPYLVRGLTRKGSPDYQFAIAPVVMRISAESPLSKETLSMLISSIVDGLAPANMVKLFKTLIVVCQFQIRLPQTKSPDELPRIDATADILDRGPLDGIIAISNLPGMLLTAIQGRGGSGDLRAEGFFSHVLHALLRRVLRNPKMDSKDHKVINMLLSHRSFRRNALPYLPFVPWVIARTLAPFNTDVAVALIRLFRGAFGSRFDTALLLCESKKLQSLLRSHFAEITAQLALHGDDKDAKLVALEHLTIDDALPVGLLLQLIHDDISAFERILKANLSLLLRLPAGSVFEISVRTLSRCRKKLARKIISFLVEDFLPSLEEDKEGYRLRIAEILWYRLVYRKKTRRTVVHMLNLAPKLGMPLYRSLASVVASMEDASATSTEGRIIDGKKIEIAEEVVNTQIVEAIAKELTLLLEDNGRRDTSELLTFLEECARDVRGKTFVFSVLCKWLSIATFLSAESVRFADVLVKTVISLEKTRESDMGQGLKGKSKAKIEKTKAKEVEEEEDGDDLAMFGSLLSHSPRSQISRKQIVTPFNHAISALSGLTGDGLREIAKSLVFGAFSLKNMQGLQSGIRTVIHDVFGSDALPLLLNKVFEDGVTSTVQARVAEAVRILLGVQSREYNTIVFLPHIMAVLSTDIPFEIRNIFLKSLHVITGGEGKEPYPLVTDDGKEFSLSANSAKMAVELGSLLLEHSTPILQHHNFAREALRKVIEGMEGNRTSVTISFILETLAFFIDDKLFPLKDAARLIHTLPQRNFQKKTFDMLEKLYWSLQNKLQSGEAGISEIYLHSAILGYILQPILASDARTRRIIDGIFGQPPLGSKIAESMGELAGYTTLSNGFVEGNVYSPHIVILSNFVGIIGAESNQLKMKRGKQLLELLGGLSAGEEAGGVDYEGELLPLSVLRGALGDINLPRSFLARYLKEQPEDVEGELVALVELLLEEKLRINECMEDILGITVRIASKNTTFEKNDKSDEFGEGGDEAYGGPNESMNYALQMLLTYMEKSWDADKHANFLSVEVLKRILDAGMLSPGVSISALRFISTATQGSGELLGEVFLPILISIVDQLRSGTKFGFFVEVLAELVPKYLAVSDGTEFFSLLVDNFELVEEVFPAILSVLDEDHIVISTILLLTHKRRGIGQILLRLFGVQKMVRILASLIRSIAHISSEARFSRLIGEDMDVNSAGKEFASLLLKGISLENLDLTESDEIREIFDSTFKFELEYGQAHPEFARYVASTLLGGCRAETTLEALQFALIFGNAPILSLELTNEVLRKLLDEGSRAAEPELLLAILDKAKGFLQLGSYEGVELKLALRSVEGISRLLKRVSAGEEETSQLLQELSMRAKDLIMLAKSESEEDGEDEVPDILPEFSAAMVAIACLDVDVTIPHVIPVVKSMIETAVLLQRRFADISSTEAGATDNRGKHIVGRLSGILSSIEKVITVFRGFLSPFYGDLIRVSLHETYGVREQLDRQIKLFGTLMDGAPARLVVPRLEEFYDTEGEVMEKSIERMRTFLEGIRRMIEAIDFDAVEEWGPRIFALLLRVFDLRLRTVNDVPLEDSLGLEPLFFDSVLSLTLKLNYNQFTPLFDELVETALSLQSLGNSEKGSETVSTVGDFRYLNRSRTLFALLSYMQNTLKDTIVPFCSTLVTTALFILSIPLHSQPAEAEEVENPREGGRKRRAARRDSLEVEMGASGRPEVPESMIRRLHLLRLQDVNSMLLKMFRQDLAEEKDRVARKRCDEILFPLIDQLANTVGTDAEFKERIEQSVVPTIIAFFVSSHDTQQWHKMNKAVCGHMRSANKKVRISSLECAGKLFERLGVELLPILPETVSYLYELLEDEDEDVEAKCRSVIHTIEGVLGESIQSYFT